MLVNELKKQPHSLRGSCKLQNMPWACQCVAMNTKNELDFVGFSPKKKKKEKNNK